MNPSPRNALAGDESDARSRILAAMQPGIRYARADLADKLGLSANEWKQAVGELVELGLVLRTGERRGTRYELASTALGDHDESDTLDATPRSEALSEEARLVEAAMQPGVEYARKDLIDATGLSVASWNRVIAELVEAGVVLRDGERRGTRYTLAASASAPPLVPQTQQPTPPVPARASVEPPPVEPPPVEPPPVEPPPPAESAPTKTARDHERPRTDDRNLGRFEVEVATIRSAFSLPADAHVEALLATRGLPPNLWPLLAALANGGGGAVILGARLRNPDIAFVKGLRQPRQLVETLRSNLGAGHVLRGIDERDIAILQADLAFRRVIALRINPRPEPQRPVYVGVNAYARGPAEGTFIWDATCGLRKCTIAEIDAMWDRWAAPYCVVRRPDHPQHDDERTEQDERDDLVLDTLLREVTGPARRHPDLGARRLREVIVRALGVRPLTLEELSELLGRKAARLEREHLAALIERQRIVRINKRFGVHATQFDKEERLG